MSDELKIVLEDVQEKFDIVIESVNMVRENLDRFRDENKQEHEELRRDIVGLQADMGTAKKDIQGLKTDMGTVKGDVQDLKADMVIVKTDVQELKSDVRDLKSDTASIRQDLNDHRTNTELHTVKSKGHVV